MATQGGAGKTEGPPTFRLAAALIWLSLSFALFP